MKLTALQFIGALAFFCANSVSGEEAFPLKAGTPYSWQFEARVPKREEAPSTGSIEIRFALMFSRAVTGQEGTSLLTFRAGDFEIPQLMKSEGVTVSEVIIEALMQGDRVTKIQLPNFSDRLSKADRGFVVLVAQEIISKALIQIENGEAADERKFRFPAELVSTVEEPELRAVCRPKDYLEEKTSGEVSQITIKTSNRTATDTTTANISMESGTLDRSVWRRIVTAANSSAVRFEHYSEISRRK